jgi:tetratricopeptide (TPR) repeat protein
MSEGQPDPTGALRTARSPHVNRRLDVAICVLLAILTAAVFSEVRSHEFINYDDYEYVVANPHVTGGLTISNIAWAFASTREANWFPLTWMSHMLDIQLFGQRSGGHHLTNVLLHVASTVLLFGFLRRTTGARWASALVALVFAVHPLRVESVAWVAERKDVLSAFFWMLTLWCYSHYVRRPGLSRYLLLLASFSLGLMAKSMLVTLPFVLLLLDWWPLNRLSSGAASTSRPDVLRRMVLEKLPLMMLSGVVGVVTYFAQRSGGSVASVELVPLLARLSNAVLSYWVYIQTMFWPTRLAVFYPLRDVTPGALLPAGLALLTLSLLAVFGARHRPYLAVGWLWYVGTLIPVIGVIQVGAQSHADRYTYLPSIGVAIMLAWGLAETVGRWPRAKPVVLAVTCVGCAISVTLTVRQLGYWRDSLTLFRHALEVTDGNYVAYNSVGSALRVEGRLEESRAHYEEAIRIRPSYAEARNNLGEVSLAQGNVAEAIQHMSEAVRIRPDMVGAHVNLGLALSAAGRPDDATREFQEALRIEPTSASALSGLGIAMANQGRTEEGLQHLSEAISLNPNDAPSRRNLGTLLARLGRVDEAIAQFQQALRLNPTDAYSHFDLGTAFAAQGRLNDAADQFAGAIRLKPDYAKAHANLGSALASMDRLDEAAKHFAEALRLDPGLAQARGNLDYVEALRAKSPR